MSSNLLSVIINHLTSCRLVCGCYLNDCYEFVEVESCEEVLSLYILIWMVSGLNFLAFFTGILNTGLGKTHISQ